MRSDKSNSGIIANSTSLKLVSITVEWDTETDVTTTGRTIDIYANTTAYTGEDASALYNSSTQGTKIGSIVCGTSTTYEVTDGSEYSYIGIRSKKSALYAKSITFVWKAKSGYEKVTDQVSFEIKTAEGYATFYTDKAYTMPEGAQGTTVVYDESTGKLTMDWAYTAGKVVPAGTPLLVQGTTGEIYYADVVADNTEEAPVANNLIGSTTAFTPTAEAGYLYYKLAYADENLTDLGWYWGAADGAPYEVYAGLCCLKIKPATSAAAPKSFLIDGTTTAISTVTNNGEGAQTIYTLSGVRVNAQAQNLPKGLYIVNGKKIIIK